MIFFTIVKRLFKFVNCVLINDKIRESYCVVAIIEKKKKKKPLDSIGLLG